MVRRALGLTVWNLALSIHVFPRLLTSSRVASSPGLPVLWSLCLGPYTGHSAVVGSLYVASFAGHTGAVSLLLGAASDPRQRGCSRRARPVALIDPISHWIRIGTQQ